SGGWRGVPRSSTSFPATAQECSDSRVYAGIHWRFDVAAGQAMGNAIGDYVASHFLLPAPPSDDEDGVAAAAVPARSAPGAGVTTTSHGPPGIPAPLIC